EKKGRLRCLPSLPIARSGPRGFGLFGDLRKSGLVVHRQVREDLAIDADPGLAEPVHEHAVAHAELADRRVDARDPQRAELALLGAAVAVLVLARLHDRLLGDLEHVVAAAAVTLGLRDHLLVASARG